MSFWHLLKTTLPDGSWIFLGDFNMTEFLEDSTGPTLLIEGRQLESWRLLKTRFDLIDAYFIPRSFIGTRYTRRFVHGLCLDQSRLDRFYLSDSRHWVNAIIHLEHGQAQTLSDHDLILLTTRLSPFPLDSLSKKKTTYFKANPSTLKVNGTLQVLQAAWENHPTLDVDPIRKFVASWSRLDSAPPTKNSMNLLPH